MKWSLGYSHTVYPKIYVHGFCFAVLCCGYILTDFPISTRLTSLALWQSNDCPSASKATLTNMDKYFMWIHYERLHNHNKAKHNKTVCIFLGIYCTQYSPWRFHCRVCNCNYFFRHNTTEVYHLLTAKYMWRPWMYFQWIYHYTILNQFIYTPAFHANKSRSTQAINSVSCESCV